ncbi:MAG: hypothetical protein LLG00_04985 [Planctomycetaceae bacterium]|nr:hypothetical protein [Planctomycetaceae bacterium]
MTQERRALQRAAIAAHRAGIGWNDFWQRRGEQVRKAEPYDVKRYHRLVNRLLSLVASGDTANVEPLDAPWLDDDLPEPVSPHDTKTQAKCQLSLLPRGCVSQFVTTEAR